MKILIFLLIHLIFVWQSVRSASLKCGKGLCENKVRVKRFEEAFAAAAQAAGGVATSMLDVAGKGAAAKDERDFDAEIPFAKFKGGQKSGVGGGDAIGEEYRRRKRAPCSRRKIEPTTTAEPPAEPEVRRKRQSDLDNGYPNNDGKIAVENFLDPFIEIAKKLSNIFVPSDPQAQSQMRQQEMDGRY